MQNPKPEKLLLEAVLGLYLILGLYGSIWISVDWDVEKLGLFSYAGLPLAFLYYSLNWFLPTWKHSYPRVARSMVGTLVGIFMVGHVLWINAVTTEEATVKRDLSIAGSIVTVKNERGGFGINYYRRW